MLLEECLITNLLVVEWCTCGYFTPFWIYIDLLVFNLIPEIYGLAVLFVCW